MNYSDQKTFVHEADVTDLIGLWFDAKLHRWCCQHFRERAEPANREDYQWPDFPLGTGRFEKVCVHLTEPHPELGPQQRTADVCCPCYGLLQSHGLLDTTGLWQGISAREKRDRSILNNIPALLESLTTDY